MDYSKKAGDELNVFGQNPEERFLVDMFSQIAERLKHRYRYSDQEILKLWNSENSVWIPVAVFAGNLSPAEALTKFLKEKLDITYHEISVIIGRDERGVWANYKRAVKKMPWPFEIHEGISVPASIFHSNQSILEALITYLKDVKNMRNGKIAQLLNKHSANVWTIYNRAKKKEKNEDK